jgi:tetratricopeptide (TPR) repeat protein
VVGDAGIGKTRLIGEYLARTPLARTVAGGCLEMGTEGIAFAPFATVLRQLVRDAGEPVAGGELARLGPALGPVPEATEESRARLFEAVLTFLEESALPGGLAVVLEDLHWADASTLDLLVFLLRNLGAIPVHLVVSVRSDDLHRTHPLRRLLPEIERLPGVGRLDVEALSREEVAEQATGLGHRADPDLLHERSGGNPLFVESLVADPAPVESALPEGPRELLLRAVEPLSETTRTVLGLASVAGDRVDHALLTRVAAGSGIGDEDLDSALRPAIDARVLRTTGTGYAFRHALLAEAVQADLLPGERVRAHRRYADALEKGVPGQVPGEIAGQVAHHAYAAHDHPRALSAAWEAAGLARAASAYPEHLELLERLLELWELVPDAAERLGLTYGELLLEVCRAAQIGGSTRRAVEHATEALADVDAKADPELAARLLVSRGLAFKELGRVDALDDLRAAAELLPEGHPERAAVSATTASVLMLRGHDSGAQEASRRAIEEARACGDRASEADALITLGSLLDVTGSEEALDLLREGIRIARELGDVQVEMRGLNNLGSNHNSRFEFEEWLACAEEALDRCVELGVVRQQGVGLVNGVASALLALGRLAQAREKLYTTPAGEDLVGGRRQALIAQLASLEGDWAASRRALDEFTRLLPRDTTPTVEYLPHYYGRMLLLLYGPGERLAETARLVLEGEREVGLLSHIRFSFSGLTTAARTVWRLRRRGWRTARRWKPMR